MNGDRRDYKLDISTLPSDEAATAHPPARPFLSVLFACCGVYQRIYRESDELIYRGACPRCGKHVKFAVRPDGTTARCFRVF